MFDKDYYQILQLLPTASASDIRKAYRRLALEFHPDKNNTQQAAAQFVIIREAYDVLSDPVQRRKYDLDRFTGQAITRRVATNPEEIRLMSDELVQRIKRTNPDRINLDKLAQDIEAVLCVYHIQLLERWNDEKENKLLVQDVLYCLHYLPWKDCIKFIAFIKETDTLVRGSEKEIQVFLSQYKRSYYWNRYKIIIALLISIATCYLIYRVK
jgi:molecular chaperone DnaJ